MTFPINPSHLQKLTRPLAPSLWPSFWITLGALFVILASLSPLLYAAQAATPAEWTLLVYLNGNNNLDPYGAADINEMEKVGSTRNVNVVVQWASFERGKVWRLKVQKDTDPKKITSPTLMDLGDADMGDWHSLVDFVRWGTEKFPAKKYFVTVWNHGSGWHRFFEKGIRPMDISWDERHGSFIKTEELGLAVGEAKKILGKKVDLYGSDACLMAMAEVAAELSDSVETFVGSEEVEPLDGWPYDVLLAEWNKHPQSNAQSVAKILAHAYTRSYQGGSQGTQEVTFSAFNLEAIEPLNRAVTRLGDYLKYLLEHTPESRERIIQSAGLSQSFTESDYRDLLDFIDHLDETDNALKPILSEVRLASKDFILANEGTRDYEKAAGVAIWLPTSRYAVDQYWERYQGLRFHKATSWGAMMPLLFPKPSSSQPQFFRQPF